MIRRIIKIVPAEDRRDPETHYSRFGENDFWGDYMRTGENAPLCPADENGFYNNATPQALSLLAAIAEKKRLGIKNVIFNKPATIVFWNDGTKTVVKCQKGDKYDKEKGLAIACMKKMFGNKGDFNEILKKYL